jgi:hypothetical protein
MKNIMVYHHLGLGDHFLCNGLVRYFLETKRPDRLFLPVKRPNYGTVARMYADQPAIVPLAVETDLDVPKLPELAQCREAIQVGFGKSRMDFDVSFYDTNGVPFALRWDAFKVCRDSAREAALEALAGVTQGEKFVLVHNLSSNGRYDLEVRSPLRQIFVTPLTDSLLDWCSLAEKAEEVHCLDSAFIHLAQSLKVKCGFFHHVVKTMGRHFALRPGWNLVQYTSLLNG